MKLKLKTSLDFFILFIIIIKICFLFFAISDAVLHHSTNKYIQQKVIPNVTLWRSQTEIIYIVSMASLLIYIFRFREGGIHGVEDDVGYLLFLFGTVLICTADWSVFFANYTWYQKFVTFITVNNI